MIQRDSLSNRWVSIWSATNRGLWRVHAGNTTAVAMETLTWVKPLPEHLDLQLAVVEVRGGGLQTQVTRGDDRGVGGTRPRGGGGGDGEVSGGGGRGGVEGGRGGKRELVGEVFGGVRRRGF